MERNKNKKKANTLASASAKKKESNERHSSSEEKKKKKIYMKPALTDRYSQILAQDSVLNKMACYIVVQKKLLKSNEFAVLIWKQLYYL